MMGELAGLGEALLPAAVEAGSEAVPEAASGVGDFFGNIASGIGDFFGGGGGEAAGNAIAPAADYSFNPGFDKSVFDYLGGAGGEAAAAGDTAGFGGSATTTGGASAFDPGAYASGAASTPDWLNGGALFDTGVAGAAPAADFSGGVGSFSAPGVSSFADTMAAGGGGPQAMSSAFGPAPDMTGGVSAFTPGPGIQTPDINAIDPTSLAATGESNIPANATFTSGTAPQAPTDLSGLDAAQKSVADQYAAVNANSVPTAPGDVSPNAAAAATPGTTPATPAASSSGKFLGMDIGKPTVLGSAGALISGGLLANNLLNKSVPGQAQVNAINSNIPQVQSVIDSVNKTAADLRASTEPLNADAKAMMSYVSQGTLPPAMQEQVKAGVAAAKTQAASIMAQHGLSADPTKNAQLKQQFDTIDSQAIQMQATLANQLYQSGLAAVNASNQTQQVAAGLQQTGLNAVGLNQNTYLALQKIYSDQDTKTQAAVTNFASALGKMTGGSGGGTTIKIGGT
jgi:hypothetical protein